MTTATDRATNAFLEQIDRPIAAFFESCVHCGMCAHACLFYTETGDPQYTPIHKLEPLRRVWEREFTLLGRIKKWLGLSTPLSEAELKTWEPLVYDSCTLCGRCALICPVGNDITYMVRKMREGMVAAGFAPDGLKEASIRALRIGSPMGVTLQTLKAQIGHAEKDVGLKIPLDQEGADYLLLMSSAEIMQFPEFLGATAKIFAQTGVSWTLCSTAFEATNSGIQIGVSDLAGVLVQRIVDGAEKLKVKTVISPECGHAYTALRWEGPNLIGRPYTFNVQHILEVLDELRTQGLLKTESFETQRLTFHDPCQLVRRGGVIEPQRHLLNMIASHYVEMSDPGKMNWCCGGGGGVSAIDEAMSLQLQAFKRKKAQLDELDVQTLVTACANCRIVIEESLEHYQMKLPVVGLTEVIAAHLAGSGAGTESRPAKEHPP
jgi:Fe-S oxidoreductase